MLKLIFSLSSLSLLVSSTLLAQFAPIPTLEKKPWRSFVGVTESVGFDPMAHTQIELKGSLIYKTTQIFDIGVALHGGFGPASKYPGLIGIDFMTRYLDHWTPWFYGGAQIIVGYTYNGLGISNRSVTIASTLPITAGPVFGFVVLPSFRLYWFPAIELGRKDYSKETGFWGQQIGFQSGLGAAIALGGGSVLSFEVKPRYASKFYTDCTAAWVLNF